jgi:chaperonin cofactor prefoldin
MNTTRGALLHDLVRRIELLEARVAELEKQKRPARKATDSEK